VQKDYKETQMFYWNEHPWWYAGRHEKTGEDHLTLNLYDLKERVQNKLPVVIIIDGMSGHGKTTLADKIACLIEGKPIEWPEQVGMGAKEFSKLIIPCAEKKHKVIIYDEAGDYNKNGFATRLNAIMERGFDTFRTYNIIVIIVLPLFTRLPNSLFDKGIPRMLIHVYGKEGKRSHMKAYDLVKMNWMRDYVTKKKPAIVQKIYDNQEALFIGWFPDLPKERSIALDIYSSSTKNTLQNIGAAELNGMFTIEKISAKLGRTGSWVYAQLKKMDIKPAYKAGKVPYYTEMTLGRMEALLKYKTSGKR
jgi:hypothetical protein